MKIVEDILNWTRKKACLQLHIPHVGVHYTLEFYDQYGNLTKTRKERSKSWFRNGYQLALSALTGYPHEGGYSAGNTSWCTTAGEVLTRTPATNLYPLDSSNDQLGIVRAPGGTTTWGIVIGTGGAAEDFNGYTMNTLIAHGYGAGLATYQTTDVYTHAYNAGTKTITRSHSRVINNNSDADISLAEIGLRWAIYYVIGTTGYIRKAQACRDLISPAENFKDKAQLRVTYSISLTYPA